MGLQRVRHDWATFSFSGSNTSLLIKIGAITINTFLPMRKKFVYSCSIKIHASRLSELLESLFCLLLVYVSVLPAKSVEMLEEVVVALREVRWIWWMRQNFITKFAQLFRSWFSDMQSGIVMGKDWALSVDQCWLQALQFSMHLIDLLSILLRCNGFTRIQKVAVDKTGSRPPNSDHDLFFWCKFDFGKCFGASFWCN